MPLLAFFLVFLLPAFASDANQQPKIIFWNMQRKSVDMLIHYVPQKDPDRLAQLKQTFHDLECKGDDLSERPTGEGTNLICTLPGVAAPGTKLETIVLTAHYEHEGQGMSAIDNWSGAVMLPFLYHALSAVPRHHTFVFAEVDGEAGSKALLRSMPGVSAVVAFEALGLGPPSFYIHPNGSVPSFTETLLKAALFRAAEQIGKPEPEASIPGSWFRIDDTRQYRYAGIAAILLHSVSGATKHLPGSADDTAERIDSDAYFSSYNLLCYYMVGLDQIPSKQLTPEQRAGGGRRR
jgi:Peptidase family M28